MRLLHELNYKSIEHNNNLESDNNGINNNMMKLSTNFYLPHTIKNEKRERPKSISNIGVIMDKKNIKKNNKLKQLNTNKNFYMKKKLNKNYSQGNIQSKNTIKINNNQKSTINENLFRHKSLSKGKLSKQKINQINKSKTIIRNNSIKRNKLNIAQKKIPIPKTSGKKLVRRKLDTKIILNINDNNKSYYNYTNTNGMYPIKNFANTTKGKAIYHMKKNNSNNLCKNLLNELSFNTNDNNNRLNIQGNYNTINVEDEKKLQILQDLSDDELRSEFLDQAQNFRNKIYKKVKPKVFHGQFISGSMLIELVQNILDTVNSGGIPVIENSWKYVMKNECVKKGKE